MKHRVLLALIFTFTAWRDWGWPTVPPQPFNAKVWRESSSTDITVVFRRFAMLDDLRANHLERGMLRADVMSLLGTPDYRPLADRSIRPLIDEYSVGASVSDPISLDCHYDAEGRLTSTRLVEH